MKKRICVAGLAGIMLFTACGNMFAWIALPRPALPKPTQQPRTQKDAENEFRSYYKTQAGRFGSAENLAELRSRWASVAKGVRSTIMRLSKEFPELPAQALYDEAIKYLTDRYLEQVKIIESFKEPVSPWEQQQPQGATS